MDKFSVIILAAGKGSRMNLGYNKVFYEIEDNLTVLEKSVKSFYDNKNIVQVIVVTSQEDQQQAQDILNQYENIEYVLGGEKRYDSVYAGIQRIKHDYVLIHDAARCFISEDQINDVIQATMKYQAASLASPVTDTIHLVNDDNMVLETVDRDYAYLAQTPQGFFTPIILEAYHLFKQSVNPINITDDVMLVNTYTNFPIKLVDSSITNIKLTYLSDLE